MIKISLLPLLVVTISGCKVLKLQETKSVQALAKAMTSSATLSGDFAKEYYSLELELKQLNVAFKVDTNQKISALKELISYRNKVDITIASYNAGYTILKSYADLLLSLTSIEHQKKLTTSDSVFIALLDTSISKFNNYTTGTKIPASFGGLASKIVDEVGSHRIRYLQRKYLNELIEEANPIVVQICDDYAVIDYYKNTKGLNTLATTIDNGYEGFVNRMRINSSTNIINPYSFFKEYDPLYLNWLNKEVALNDLNRNSAAAMTKIKKAHQQLIDDVNKKGTFKEFVASVNDLYGSITNIQESYQKLKTDLTPAKSTK